MTISNTKNFLTRPPSYWATRLWRSAVLLSTAIMMAPLTVSADEVFDKKMLEGKRTFDIHCAVCHGFDGSGGAGPSLADDLTLHGADLEDILKVVTNGVRGKPMNAWADKLSPDVIARVSAYVHSLLGTRPTSANPNDRRTLM